MTARPVYQLSIRTPEGVSFALPLASPVTRALAWFVDLACILVLMQIATMIVGLLALISFDLAIAMNFLLYFVISVGYGIVCEWFWRGQTVGKRMLHLRVMDADGLHLRFSQVAMRNLVRVADSLPAGYALGGVVCLVSRQAQRLGDLAAGTVVVRYPRLGEPELSKIRAGKYNSFESYPVLAARLRQAISPAEGRLLIDALLQRERFDPDARLELYRELADHFREKIAFPQEATEGLSDEQYLVNVAATLYRLPAASQQREAA